MSEQLTLEGLTGLQPQPEKLKEQPAKSRRVSPKSRAEEAIEARIQALIEQKARQDLQLFEAAAQTASAVENPPGQKEVIIQEEATVKTTLILSTGEVTERVTEETTEEIENGMQEKPSNQPDVITVSNLNKSIKGLLEKNFTMVWVRGEISNLKMPSSGHMYFTLKDSGAQVRSVMFRGYMQQLQFRPEDGMEVIVRCRVTVYEPRGDYQLFCEVMEPVGYGALQVAFEKLKAKLQAEGLFEQARKRPIPSFPTRIGIITSPTGAAIRDMLNVLGRRFGGGVDITLLPTNVQGDKAPGEISRAIDLASKMGLARFDVLIVGRGGGSIEDLWAFNTEEVARAVSRSSIPTISAVGHEVDFTICDFVADLRAPTPSAAAELVVKNKADLLDRLKLLRRQLVQQEVKKLQLLKTKADGTAKRLTDPKRRLQDLMLRTDEWSERLIQMMERYLVDTRTEMKFLREKMGTPEKRLEQARQNVIQFEQRVRSTIHKNLELKKNEFSGLAYLLNSLSPLAILERGYSIVKKDGQIIKSSTHLRPGDEIEVTFHQGGVRSKVIQ